MIDQNKLPIPEKAILEAAKVLYEAHPIRTSYGYFVKWDDIEFPFQKVHYLTLARRMLRAAEGVRVALEPEVPIVKKLELVA